MKFYAEYSSIMTLMLMKLLTYLKKSDKVYV